MRACAIEMHFNISQALYTEICRKNAADQNEPRTQTNILCEPARSKHMPRFHKNRFIQKFTGKMLQPRVSTLRPLHLPKEPLSVDTVFWEEKPEVIIPDS